MSTASQEQVRRPRRQPMQRRSREKVDQILEAAAELIHHHGVEEISTRLVAERSGVPVPTLYRYFANCDEIIAAFLDREMEEIAAEVADAVFRLERVTLRRLMEAAALAHLRHHQRKPMAVILWFGGRQSAIVRDRVREEDRRIAASLNAIATAAGFVRDDAPAHGAELLVRLADRTFEFVLLEHGGPPEEQEAIVRDFVDMIATHTERYTTPAAVRGMPGEEFRRALGASESLLTEDLAWSLPR